MIRPPRVRLNVQAAAVLALGIALLPLVMGAQTAGAEPFDTVRLQAGYLNGSNLGGLDDFYENRPALEISAATPFYWGQLEIGFQRFQAQGRIPERPDFDAYVPYVAFLRELRLFAGMEASAGIRTGVQLMSFEQVASAPRSGVDESELGFGIVTGLRRAISQRWHVEARGQYRVVLTSERLHYVSYGVALGRTFTAPAWLTGALE